MDFQSIKFKNRAGEDTVIRAYIPGKDIEAAYRLIKEVGWTDTDKGHKAADKFLSMGLTLVGEINGSMECISASAPGDMMYLDDTLVLEGVTAVLTGMPARRKGVAQIMTAQLMMYNAANGSQVSVLGVFDTGFYDRLGYGTAPYEHQLICDLADLRPSPSRTPVRLTEHNIAEIHKVMLARKRGHGGCNIYGDGLTNIEFEFEKNLFGLGYRDSKTNELTHFLLGTMEGENGPLSIGSWFVWQNAEQLRELIGLLASLGDQIWSATIPQPRGVHIQDLVKRPLKMRPVHTGYSLGSIRMSGVRVFSSWQFRIMDLEGCIARTKIYRGEVKFNLQVSDPLSKFATEATNWQPLDGDWTITFGRKSQAKRGATAGLPLLKASIGAFSRLWGGGATALGLSITDDFVAPAELLNELDKIMDLPSLEREWHF